MSVALAQVLLIPLEILIPDFHPYLLHFDLLREQR